MGMLMFFFFNLIMFLVLNLLKTNTYIGLHVHTIVHAIRKNNTRIY